MSEDRPGGASEPVGDPDRHPWFTDLTEEDLRDVFETTGYVADETIVTTTLLALRLGKPLLIEGEPGAGKTELAKVLAEGVGNGLIRLQCYEGLTAEQALYEWNYTKQLLEVQTADDESGPQSVFDEEYLLERPLVKALRVATDDGPPPVLLVDEIDRADAAFEALLLEVLSDFQVTVPELGTIAAEVPPVVVVTSNRSRGLSDALKRRCLYLHIEPPSSEKERAILARKVPELDGAIAAELCAIARRLREEPLFKPPGAAETIDWARAVAELREGPTGGGAGRSENALSKSEIRTTIGCLLKEVQDVERVDDDLLAELRDVAKAAHEEAQ